MKKIGSLLLAAVLTVVPMTSSFAQESHSNLSPEEKAKQWATTVVTDYGASAVQYAIVDHGKVILSGHAGIKNQATKEKITPDTMFGIGSVSKMYVSSAVMMLVDAGKIDIDQPLTTYIPDFKMADERYTKITPRTLLNHSSGLYGSHYHNSILFDDNDTQNYDNLLKELQTEHLKADPGAFSVYSNDSFQLLEVLVERVSGMSYSEFVKTRISDPMKFKSTHTPLDQFDRKQLSKTYFPGIESALPVENANILGTGGIYSTAEELATFGDVLMGNKPELLSEKSAQAMQKDEYRNGIWVPEERNTTNYGLGWDAVNLAPFSDYGIKALSKGGDTIMYHADLISLPGYDMSAAVVSAGGSSLYNTQLATQLLLEELKDQGKIKKILPDQTFKPAVQVNMPAEMKQYAGLYGTLDKTIQLELKNGTMELPDILGGIIPAQTYVYTGKQQFTSKDGSTIISFDKQTNGKTYIKVNTTVSFPGLGQAAMVFYEYQKLSKNKVSTAVQQAWKARDGKRYYAVDEKINSAFYIAPSILTKTLAVDASNGYVNGDKIIDQNHAVNVAQIPVMTGRDTFDFEFVKQNKVEYLKTSKQLYIPEDAISPLSKDKSSTIKIASNGHVKWFKINKNTAGKTINVDYPNNAGFVVYDAKGNVVESSIITSKKSAILPENGLIVFGGQAGNVFKVTLGQGTTK
ncbi:serine hydrolase [Paenibacillus sp. PsM32]|uniref:serine hydrolase domain-containing protein n=1 Tax=Paenibacillus sp. PsM32 TaxID=3030536 RepID=UPI00263B8FA8|nr:serine hydrolase domain-containing protein [Paenibacillus sp. PsM32]MDN4618085.1 serine hydrolase [Paenibacillus sp. PsM32]